MRSDRSVPASFASSDAFKVMDTCHWLRLEDDKKTCGVLAGYLIMHSVTNICLHITSASPPYDASTSMCRAHLFPLLYVDVFFPFSMGELNCCRFVIMPYAQAPPGGAWRSPRQLGHATQVQSLAALFLLSTD